MEKKTANINRRTSVFKQLQALFKGTTTPSIANSSTDTTPISNSNSSYFTTSEPIQLTDEEHEKLVKETLLKLNQSETTFSRIQFLKEFTNFVKHYQLKDVRTVWNTIQDLVNDEQSSEIQQIGFRFLVAFIEGQYSELNELRRVFFKIIKTTNAPLETKIELLKVLTKEGREINQIEQEIGPLLVGLLSQFDLKTMLDLQNIVIHVFKYHFSLLDEEVREEITSKGCQICNRSPSTSIVNRWLLFFDVIIRYGNISSHSLPLIIDSLARTVNIETFSAKSWEIMSKILMSHYGHQGVRILCAILDDPGNHYAVNLLRGSVFFIGMSLWGSKRISSLHTPPIAVLPSLLNILSCKSNIVFYEVLLVINRLVKKYGNELRVEWDILFSIFNQLQSFLEDPSSGNTSFASVFSELVNTISELSKNNAFFGKRSSLLSFLDKTTQYQDENSVLYQISEKSKLCEPLQIGWLENLKEFMEIFFQQETRVKIRLASLLELKRIYHSSLELYPFELVDLIVLPFLGDLSLDKNFSIKQEALDFLIEVASQNNTHFNQLIQAIEKITNSSDDIKLRGVLGLLRLFRAKFHHSPVSHVLTLFPVLLKYIYSDNFKVKKEILSCVLSIGATPSLQATLSDHQSPFLLCNPFRISLHHKNVPKGVAIFPFVELFNSLLYLLQHEKNLENFTMVTSYFLRNLHNRTLILCGDINRLCSLLCNMLEKRTFGDSISISDQTTLNKEANFIAGYDILSLIIYKSELNLEQQNQIISACISGITGKWNLTQEGIIKIQRYCICILSVCLLEFSAREIMLRIPIILENCLSLLASIPELSVHVLEYLALLSTTKLVRKFSSHDFEIVFNLLLSFLSNKKNSPFLASRACQIIALWFVASPLLSRPNYFALLTKQLYGLMKERPLLLEANIDLLARYTYTDIDITSIPEKQKNDYLFNESSLVKIWLTGNSIVTVKIGRMGWCQVIWRRPTGAVTFLMQLQNPHLFLAESALISPFQSKEFSKIHKNIVNDIYSFALPEHPSPTTSPKPQDITLNTNNNNNLTSSGKQINEKSNQTFKDPIPALVQPTPKLSSALASANFIESNTSIQPVDIPNQNNNVSPPPFGDKASPPSGFLIPSLHVDDQEEEISVLLPEELADSPKDGSKSPLNPLSSFYPPLPSYEAEKDIEQRSPPFLSPPFVTSIGKSVLSTPFINSESYKLTHDAQMMLHLHSGSEESNPSIELNSLPEKSTHSFFQQQEQNETSSKTIPISSVNLNVNPPINATNPPLYSTQKQSPPSQSILLNNSNSNVAILEESTFTQPSVVFPAQTNLMENSISPSTSPVLLGPVISTIDPNIIFLQLQQIPFINPQQQVLKGEGLERAISVLDRTVNLEIHKFGLIYVGPNQTTEEQILSNRTGSPGYLRFLHKLGKIIKIEDKIEDGSYTGGLDLEDGKDGEFALFWSDTVTEIVFHVATLMPNLPSDKSFTNKKRHIGNDNVIIVYSDSSTPYKHDTLKGQFNFVNIVISPLDKDYYLVEIQKKREVPSFGPIISSQIVSENALISLVRQCALNGDLSSTLLTNKNEFTSKIEERLKQIKQIGSRFGSSESSDFIQLAHQSLSTSNTTSPSSNSTK